MILAAWLNEAAVEEQTSVLLLILKVNLDHGGKCVVFVFSFINVLKNPFIGAICKGCYRLPYGCLT